MITEADKQRLLKAGQEAAKRPRFKKYRLSPRAALVAAFIEDHCTLSKGKSVAQPFVLMPWQFKAIKGIYKGKPGDPRVIRRALITLARKNGKSEFASALVLVHLCGPEAGYGERIYCAAAASEKQASIVWDGARQMLLNNPVFKAKYADKTRSAHDGAILLHDSIVWEPRNNSAMTIGTRSSSAQGLIPSMWTFDEIAETKDREFYEALNLSDDATKGLGLIVSTRSTDIESLFSILHDEIVMGQKAGINKHWYLQVHSADPTVADPLTMAQVRKANPAIGHILDESDLQIKLDNAIASPSARPEFRARVLNIESGTEDSLVDPSIWAKQGLAIEPREALYDRMAGERAVIGIDMGGTRSLTALAVYWPDRKTISAVSFMAKSQVEINATLHKVQMYQEWANDGRLILVADDHHGGMTFKPLARWIKDLYDRFNVVSLRYDGWRSSRLFDELLALGMDKDRQPLSTTLDEFRQGPKSYSPAIDEFEDALLSGDLWHDNDPVSNMAINVCRVKAVNTSADDTRQPAKNKQQVPNDAAVAMLMAYSMRELRLSEPKRDSGWLDRFYGISA